MSVTHQQVLDATASVEMHHFRDTSVVVCALLTVGGRVVLGVGSVEPLENVFDLATVAGKARSAADAELANQLAQELAGQEPPKNVAERSC